MTVFVHALAMGIFFCMGITVLHYMLKGILMSWAFGYIEFGEVCMLVIMALVSAGLFYCGYVMVPFTITFTVS
jgi:hypothetical protein